MIDRKVSEEELSSNKKLIRSMIENISLALERIEITIERVRDRQRMEQERRKPMIQEKILVAEDDIQIQNFMVYTLENAGFEVAAVPSGKEAIECMIRKDIDLILFDLGPPDMDGMDVLHKVREWSGVPIIIVSARDQDKEKVTALDDGADDYLTKPFSATELMARIRVALRHYYRMNQKEEIEKPDDAVYTNGEICLDNGKYMVYNSGQEIHLTPMEYNLLYLFMRNPGKVLTYHTILQKIRGDGYGEDTQVLRSVMVSTRRKIENNPAKPEYIRTEIGIGYRMRERDK